MESAALSLSLSLLTFAMCVLSLFSSWFNFVDLSKNQFLAFSISSYYLCFVSPWFLVFITSFLLLTLGLWCSSFSSCIWRNVGHRFGAFLFSYISLYRSTLPFRGCSSCIPHSLKCFCCHSGFQCFKCTDTHKQACGFGECTMCTWKEISRHYRSWWLILFFKSLIFIDFFCLVLPIIKRGNWTY